MSEITKVPSVLTVVEDGGEYVIRAHREIGEAMAKTILSQLKEAYRVTYITDTDMKVFRAEKGSNAGQTVRPVAEAQTPSPKKEPISAPVPHEPVPASRRIIQDESAPPSPELVEENYEAMMRQQEREAQELARQDQFNRQQAVPPEAVEEEAPVAETPRKRTRNIATPGSPCGRCGGGGSVMCDDGVTGACPVCQGKGQIQTWGRGRR